jgi:hypothetical protein
MSAAKAARIGYRKLLAGRTVAIPGLVNKLAAQAGRFFPRAFVRFVVGTHIKQRMR